MSNKFFCLSLCSTICFSATLLSESAEFSEPRDFSNFGSNIGAQQLIEVAVLWVGAKPQEIAPGSKPLGSLKGKKYILSSGDGEFINQESEPVKPSPSWPTPKPVNTPPPKTQSWSVEEEPKPVNQKDKWKGSRRWVGQRPHELAPMVMDANLFNQRNETRKSQRDDLQIEEQIFDPEPGEVLSEKPADEQENEKPLNMSLFLSSRPYYSHNVLRLNDAKDGAWVMENTVGASLSVKPVEIGDYMTMLPRLDMMMQIAAYEDKNVGGTSLKETLGYRFGLVKIGLGIELPKDYIVSLGYEYNLISSLDTGNKMSDAYTPSVRFGKMFSLNESTLLSFDVTSRLSSTDTIKPLATLPTNDGDNFQVGWTCSLIKILGDEGQFMIMPNLGVSRTEYLKHAKDGVISRTISAGVTGSWRLLDWLSWDVGLNYTLYRSTEGLALNPGAEYQSLDFGTTLMASYLF